MVILVIIAPREIAPILVICDQGIFILLRILHLNLVHLAVGHGDGQHLMAREGRKADQQPVDRLQVLILEGRASGSRSRKGFVCRRFALSRFALGGLAFGGRALVRRLLPVVQGEGRRGLQIVVDLGQRGILLDVDHGQQRGISELHAHGLGGIGLDAEQLKQPGEEDVPLAGQVELKVAEVEVHGVADHVGGEAVRAEGDAVDGAVLGHVERSALSGRDGAVLGHVERGVFHQRGLAVVADVVQLHLHVADLRALGHVLQHVQLGRVQLDFDRAGIGNLVLVVVGDGDVVGHGILHHVLLRPGLLLQLRGRLDLLHLGEGVGGQAVALGGHDLHGGIAGDLIGGAAGVAGQLDLHGLGGGHHDGRGRRFGLGRCGGLTVRGGLAVRDGLAIRDGLALDLGLGLALGFGLTLSLVLGLGLGLARGFGLGHGGDLQHDHALLQGLGGQRDHAILDIHVLGGGDIGVGNERLVVYDQFAVHFNRVVRAGQQVRHGQLHGVGLHAGGVHQIHAGQVDGHADARRGDLDGFPFGPVGFGRVAFPVLGLLALLGVGFFFLLDVFAFLVLQIGILVGVFLGLLFALGAFLVGILVGLVGVGVFVGLVFRLLFAFVAFLVGLLGVGFFLGLLFALGSVGFFLGLLFALDNVGLFLGLLFALGAFLVGLLGVDVLLGLLFALGSVGFFLGLLFALDSVGGVLVLFSLVALDLLGDIAIGITLDLVGHDLGGLFLFLVLVVLLGYIIIGVALDRLGFVLVALLERIAVSLLGLVVPTKLPFDLFDLLVVRVFVRRLFGLVALDQPGFIIIGIFRSLIGLGVFVRDLVGFNIIGVFGFVAGVLIAGIFGFIAGIFRIICGDFGLFLFFGPVSGLLGTDFGLIFIVGIAVFVASILVGRRAFLGVVLLGGLGLGGRFRRVGSGQRDDQDVVDRDQGQLRVVESAQRRDAPIAVQRLGDHQAGMGLVVLHGADLYYAAQVDVQAHLRDHLAQQHGGIQLIGLQFLRANQVDAAVLRDVIVFRLRDLIVHGQVDLLLLRHVIRTVLIAGVRMQVLRDEADQVALLIVAARVVDVLLHVAHGIARQRIGVSLQRVHCEQHDKCRQERDHPPEKLVFFSTLQEVFRLNPIDFLHAHNLFV